MILPNFLCLGAQKSGTTSLYDMLSKHADVYLPKQKELDFFQIDENYSKGIEYYSQHFQAHRGEKIIGEISPDYMVYERVCDRIIRTLGREVKLMFIVRNPVDRAYSQFNHHRMLGVEQEPNFEKAIRREKLERNISFRESWFSPAYYLSKGLYYEQIKRYFEYFDRENILVVIFEGLFVSKDKGKLNEVFNFLNIENFEVVEHIHSAKSTFPKNKKLFELLKREKPIKKSLKYILGEEIYRGIRKNAFSLVTKKPEPIDRTLRAKLIHLIYLDDIMKLQDLTGLDLNLWYK